jgi:uncharacterized protein
MRLRFPLLLALFSLSVPALRAVNADLAPASQDPYIRMLRWAAEQGAEEAQYQLGLSYATGHRVDRDPMEAIRWYRLAAESGDPHAQFNLGLLLEQGDGLAADPAAALAWYRRAARQGLVDAQMNLAFLYAEGAGASRNLRHAFLWFTVAAALGNPDAASNCAALLRHLPSQDLAAAQQEAAEILEGIRSGAACEIAPGQPPETAG